MQIETLETQQKIAQRVLDTYSQDVPDWSQIIWKHQSAGGAAGASVEIVNSNGVVSSVEVDSDLMVEFELLRRTMATKEHGAWYIATLTVKSEGSYELDFDYDSKPAIASDVEIVDEIFIEDQERAPRSADDLPNWHPSKSLQG